MSSPKLLEVSHLSHGGVSHTLMPYYAHKFDTVSEDLLLAFVMWFKNRSGFKINPNSANAELQSWSSAWHLQYISLHYSAGLVLLSFMEKILHAVSLISDWRLNWWFQSAGASLGLSLIWDERETPIYCISCGQTRWTTENNSAAPWLLWCRTTAS